LEIQIVVCNMHTNMVALNRLKGISTLLRVNGDISPSPR
jgi:hypothetical protein